MSSLPLQSRHVRVSVAHRYWRSEWDAEANQKAYGQDASTDGLGANLKIEVWAASHQDQSLLDLDSPLIELKSLVDHRAFFEDFEEFHETPSTLENITLFLAARLFQTPPSRGRWCELRVWQDKGLFCATQPDSSTVDFGFSLGNLQVVCRGPVDPVSGLFINREKMRAVFSEAVQTVDRLQLSDVKSWGESLCRALQSRLPGVMELSLRLGRQKYLIHV